MAATPLIFSIIATAATTANAVVPRSGSTVVETNPNVYKIFIAVIVAASGVLYIDCLKGRDY